ncbi:DUF3800 domain-containing protein [Mycolicibacterium sphagni]|uniref:DUF3800 domain-containing protein n=1 Tax=Mycolicibacterium sphagni TaxID=1786 RepID=UPI0021F30F83|nr:DUF3800 domain-containing protein [Mycolicibacterium sphagni]MCV7176754.1 DUF3800 domain-containing protein [Mycolicibacterium sphagni]
MNHRPEGDAASDLPIGLHTFIDESYGEDDYYVGGLVLTPDQLAAIERELEAFKAVVAEKFDVPESIEFHAHEIMHGKGSWRTLDGRVHESVWVCRRVLQIAANSGARIHIQGVDVRRLNARYRYPDSPYRVTLRHLLERVHDECQWRRCRSTVTADILDESDTATAAIAGFVRKATPGYRSTRLCHIEPMNYVDSQTSLGVQAADVVTYAARRHLEVRDGHPRALKAARQLFNVVQPRLTSCRKWEP